ncbi:LacI family DNA-binding transcriptional regulator [Halomonas sp. MCCC 1A17488]|uniref:LacI family DNA-binding transcriptional regulator n=1 Tax=Billgrantia sulfidoxydans TaxID=2733484 RepID=A0ABX7W759_9GAMM|nr:MULTISPECIES: LacI family DNA-binding transcriptional regulator [Halomonas]MCE8017614.1 LacI family DNA-binding transcriptional regulator [Halomonas sp. MCCC 1A17488]MCG3240947.1 LacI family DNA-binding transcriptional regulator [Halomonas sp. MCCC 1A17488]QPP48817.1 LacI family DNA-binding transcriptional regulator [Halomonas sp. SS10-MC5]QTP56149.1 LacI family DNA-binding transcriptional regulator [Halomonas sulfidoxydans]
MSNEAHSPRRRRGSEQPTLKEVAEAAGVSAITASRALNHPDQVNERTRARVLEAVERLGYVPNLVAGSLASARSRFIAVIVPSLANTVFIEVIQGLQETFEAQGYQILLGNTDYDTEREYQLVRTFLGWSCSALVTAGLRHSQACRTLLANWDKPIMEVMELGEALDLNVGLDHTEAGRCMARHLLERGHRRVLFVGARLASDYRAGMRYAGHREVLEQAGLAAPLIELDHGGLDAGAAGLARALENHGDVSAIHFANDDLATGALLHAQRLGIRVPHELAIAGFNGLPIGQHITPRLTTIRSPRQHMGQLAASEVIRRLEGKRIQRLQHDVGFELLIGEST